MALERHGSVPVYQPGGELVEISQGCINWRGRDPNWTDTIGFRGPYDVEYPVGEWNTVE